MQEHPIENGYRRRAMQLAVALDDTYRDRASSVDCPNVIPLLG
jgi:hypothetical protein